MAEIILPDGVRLNPKPRVEEFPPPGHGLIVNESEVPDQVLRTYFEENASLIGMNPSNTFQTYVATGNVMTRPKWRPPQNIVEEIVMCRELAERDDDVGATIGMMIGLAFGEGLQNVHRDEVTIALFDKVGEHSCILESFKEMYREWLIASQVTTAVVFERQDVHFTPSSTDRQRMRTLAIPRIGVIPAEQVHVVGNDLFGTARLAYRPFSGRQEQWLMEFFGVDTSPGRKAQMRREDPVLTTLLTEQIAFTDMIDGGVGYVYGDPRDPIIGRYIYTLNPQMVSRVSAPKGQWQHPRPMLSKNLPLLEAKRLLMIMDHAFLEAGANFLVVVKKGTDAKPALPEEIVNLRDTIVRASRSGVLVGDHRLDVEVITPNLNEMLNPEKRKLIGRKLASALLRVPDFGSSDTAGNQEILADTEILSRVITSDRDDLRRHVHRAVYHRTAQLNDNVNGAAQIWFPKIVLQGLQYFQDLILGLRDRGDIPRKYAVEAAGMSWDAAVAQRKREVASGDDKVMVPAAVPFSSPNAGPQDRGGGRPTGSKTGQATPTAPGSSKPTVQKNAGETIKAMWEGDEIVRVGEQTLALLEEYEDAARVGRITPGERAALTQIAAGGDDAPTPLTIGPLTIFPLNAEHAHIEDLKAVRLAEGLSVLLGHRLEDQALLARALVFREPTFTSLQAEETALRLGYEV